MQHYTCQVVVVGTGAGGAVAAAVLAQSGLDTIMIEQGRNYAPSDFGDVVSGLTQMYVHGGMTVALGNPPIAIPLGNAVGGTTLINSSTCFRPPREKVDQWGCLSWDELVPSFETVEKRIHAVPADISVLGGNYRVLKRGCDALGIEIKPLVHNIDGCQGSGRCAFGCPTGAKQSMDRTFIPDALGAGARLLTEHCVTGVLRRGNRLAGVTGTAKEGAFEVRAEAVILALGALATPAFLLRHRLANSSKRVGRGLRIHPACRVAAEFDEIIDGDMGLPQGAYIDHWHKQGVMLEGISLPPGPLLSALPGAGASFKEIAARRRNMATFGIMVSDTTSGRVCRGWGDFPFMAFYQLCQADAETLRFGMIRLGELYFAAGAVKIYTNVLPMPVIGSLDELKQFETCAIRPSGFEAMAFHPTGTCAMSAHSGSGVVGPDLRSWDIPNLFIMDGSVIPNALGVNPQVTIMALAHHGAMQFSIR